MAKTNKNSIDGFESNEELTMVVIMIMQLKAYPIE